ncbi:MAG: DUF4258 domain-containing protein [Parachlamydia sp.]|nr:DUF4258 domain-containing protein [Parachlamydia sp.]
MSKILAFPKVKDQPLSLEKLVKRTHELAKQSEAVFWDCPHVQQRMKERNVTMMQILDVLIQGKGISGPTLDKYGDWRIKLRRYSAGRMVQVVVAVKGDHLEVITVI